MNQTELHQQECLEAEIRRMRQCLRNLADAALAGQSNLKGLALRAKLMLGDPDPRLP